MLVSFVFEASRREPQEVHPSRPPMVDPREQTVNEGDPAQFRCWIPSDPNARLRWLKVNHAPLPYGVSDDGSGMLYIPRAQSDDGGYYICSVLDPNGNVVYESEPARLEVAPVDRRVSAGEPRKYFDANLTLLASPSCLHYLAYVHKTASLSTNMYMISTLPIFGISLRSICA